MSRSALGVLGFAGTAAAGASSQMLSAGVGVVLFMSYPYLNKSKNSTHPVRVEWAVNQ
jgi:hypothetical protein